MTTADYPRTLCRYCRAHTCLRRASVNAVGVSFFLQEADRKLRCDAQPHFVVSVVPELRVEQANPFECTSLYERCSTSNEVVLLQEVVCFSLPVADPGQ